MPGLLTWPLAGLAGVTLPGWVGGLVVLLLVLAVSFLLRKPLVYILTRIPVIGGGLANIIGSAVDTVQGWAYGWLGPIAYGIATLILAPAQLGVALLSGLVGAAEYIMGTTRRTVTTLYSATGVLYQQRVAAANIASIRSHDIPAARAAAIAAAVASARLLVGSEANSRAAGDAAARAAAAALVGVEASERNKAVAAARTAAMAAVAAEANQRRSGDELLDRQAKAGAAAAAAAAAALSTRVGELEHVRVPALEDELTTIRTRTIPAEVSRATAAEVALAGELTLAQQALRCLDPLCGSGYAGLVGQLLQGAELLAILELVGQAVHDPEGTAHSTAGMADGLHGLTAGLLSPFIGQA